MSIISLFFLLFGNSNGPVNDLRKKPTHEDNLRSFNCWVQRYFYVLCFMVLAVCVVGFLAICIMNGISMVESGTMRNFLATGV